MAERLFVSIKGQGWKQQNRGKKVGEEKGTVLICQINMGSKGDVFIYILFSSAAVEANVSVFFRLLVGLFSRE